MPNADLANDAELTESAMPTGRRARNRIARHDQLMTASMEILASEGIEGLTMMAVADRVGCAVGTIYTYFESKSALISALEATAIRKLMDVFHAAADRWEDGIEELDVPDDIASLVRIIATARLFVALDSLQPREFEMLQMLLTVKQDLTTNEDRDSIIPVALSFLADINSTIEEAVATGAINAPGHEPYGGIDQPADSAFDRTIRWISAINGALMTTHVGVDPERVNPSIFDGRRLGLSLNHDMLVGWGAQKGALREAHRVINALESSDRLLPPSNPASTDPSAG